MKQGIIRISQAEPGAGAPPPPPPAEPMPPIGGGGLDLGMGLGAPPIGGGAPPAPPAGGGNLSAKTLNTPLENLGQILEDVNIKKVLSEKLSNTLHEGTHGEEEIANEIWAQYGGGPLGGVIPGRKGERIKKKIVDEEEIERTDETRWKRLPEGKNLLDLGITLPNMIDMVKAISFSLSKEMATQKPGGGGPMASSKKTIRIAQLLDAHGFYDLADILLK